MHKAWGRDGSVVGYRKGGKEGHLVGFSAKVPPTKKKWLTSSFSVKREARETMKERRKQNERNGGWEEGV